MSTANHHSSGIYLIFNEKKGWLVLGATSRRYPQEVKFVGGSNKHHEEETVEETLVREFCEQAELTPTDFFQIYKRTVGDHTQYFFLVVNVSGQLDPSKEWEVNKRDKDELTLKWWDLAEFNQKLFKNQRPAFEMALRIVAKYDRQFRRKYPNLLPICGGSNGEKNKHLTHLARFFKKMKNGVKKRMVR